MSSSEKTNIFPYEFIDAKTEIAGENNNKMELYAYRGELDMHNIKQFCVEKKNAFTKGFFYFLVLFDEKENANFPSDPFPAAFSNEQKYLEHIRAYYVYNTVNKHSKLQVYENNKWQSEAKEYDI